MLLPIMVLVAWTMVMCIWMCTTRVSSVVKMRMKLDPSIPRGEQMSQLPAPIRWKADNYNHLLEQPTLFYATAIVIFLMRAEPGINLALAWAYVILRIIHSLWQAFGKSIQGRFLLFALSSLCLLIMVVSTLITLFYMTTAPVAG